MGLLVFVFGVLFALYSFFVMLYVLIVHICFCSVCYFGFCIWVRDFYVSYVGLRLSADYYVGVPLFGCWSLSVCDFLYFR